MLLALVCTLCAVQPLQATDGWSLREPRLTLREAGAEAPPSPLHLAPPATPASPQRSLGPAPLASLQPLDFGSGDGDHADHLSPMWIMMGVMVVFMVVGMGVYAMNHGSAAARPSQAAGLSSPAALAIPVVAGGGG